MDGMLAGPVSKEAHLPGGLTFSIAYDEATLTFGPPPHPDMPPPLTRAHALNVPGETAAEGWLVTTRIGPAHDETPQDGAMTARLAPALAGEPLSLRARQPGDRFQPLGMTGRKKLKDFLIDDKVPRAHRDRVPLLVTPRGIAWVPGHRIAHWARVPPKLPASPPRPPLPRSLAAKSHSQVPYSLSAEWKIKLSKVVVRYTPQFVGDTPT